MDPLTDVLSLMRPQNTLSAGFHAGGPWAIAFPAAARSIKCGAVVSGECWLKVEGDDTALHLGPGEGFVLPQGRPFRMASGLDIEPVPAGSIFPPAGRGGISRLGEGDDCFMVSSRFVLQGPNADMLMGFLPAIVHIDGGDEQQALRWSVERMMAELRIAQPGGQLVIQQLAHMILVQALRAHLDRGYLEGGGWLSALSDRQIGAAMRAIHAQPGHSFTIAGLAGIAGMSRSSFALRFREVVGKAPMEYLTEWRMMLAADRMQTTQESVSAIALSLGYESESAFSKAFKRVMGAPPRSYGRKEQSAA